MRPLARDAADRAVRANPNLSEAQHVSGYERWLLEWDWKEAESRLRTAVDLDPSNGQAYRSLGHVLSQAGRDDEAEAAMARARELEPTDVLAYALSSQVAAQARHFDRAIEHARRAILLDPQFWIGHIMLGSALDSAGEPELALEALAQAGRYLQRQQQSAVDARLRVGGARSCRRRPGRAPRAGGEGPWGLRAAVCDGAGARGPWQSGGGVGGARAGVRRG